MQARVCEQRKLYLVLQYWAGLGRAQFSREMSSMAMSPLQPEARVAINSILNGFRCRLMYTSPFFQSFPETNKQEII